MIIAVAGYVLASLLVFGRALVPPEGQMIFGDDIHRAYYFFREFFNHWIRQGIFPWWNPYMFGGEPFIANPIVNIWYPPTWIFSVFALPIAYSWHLFLHVVWAMTGMYVFNQQLTGNNAQLSQSKKAFNMGSWVSGIVFGLSGFFMARTFAGHVDVVAAASWIPWVVWAFYRVLVADRIYPKRMALAALFFALQLLAGYQTMAMMSVIIIGVCAIAVCVSEKRIAPFIRAAVAGILGIGLAAIQVIPVQEFFRMSIRTYKFPYQWHAYGSLEWHSFIQLLNPFAFGTPETYNGPPPNFIEHSMFVGILGLLLACIGILSLFKRDKHRHVAVVVASVCVVLIGFWISLGPSAGIDLQYLLWKFVPMYQYLRIPPRHIILAVFGLSVLAGVGAKHLIRTFPGMRVLRYGVLLLLVVEMVIFGRNFIELKEVPSARHEAELITLVGKDTEPFRLLQNYGAWLPQRDAMDFDSGLSYGIFSATGYDPSILRPYFEYVSRVAGESGEHAILSHDVQVPYLSPAAASGIDRLNIKYIQVPQGFDPFSGNARYRVVRESPAFDYRVYENTSVMPRFFLGTPCGTIRIGSYTPNEITLSTEVTCNTRLESSEVWYPGWEAYIDGKKTRIDKTDNVFRTLIISPGNHTIIYRYNPRIFVISGGISLFTLVFLLGWLRRGVRGIHHASI